MSLKSDFARNRAVFEILTGASAEPADSARSRMGTPREARSEQSSAESASRIPEPFEGLTTGGLELPEQKVPSKSRLSEGKQTAPMQSFSLTYGSKRATDMALSFEAPDGTEFPLPEKISSEIQPAPLESLYHELDVRARMSSQLCQEEEF